MGEFKKNTIADILKLIEKKQMLIPVFQRKYVWKPKNIEELFNSIMKDYPIGTFLFWNVNRKIAEKYAFYNFLNSYHEMYEFLINTKAEIPQSVSDIYGVIDGQQRLSSIYFGLKGFVTVKKPRLRKGKLKNYEDKYLFLNLFNIDPVNDNYEFKFLKKEGLKTDNFEKKQWWFQVNDILLMDYEEIDEKFDDMCNELEIPVSNISSNKKKLIKKSLRKLHNKLNIDKIIGIFELNNKVTDIDKLIDIFILVNRKGSSLKLNDLLFSTLTASWREARDEIQELITLLDKIQPSFYSEDFVLRCCLVLSGKSVLFKPEGFNEDVVNSIKNNWTKIKTSILSASKVMKKLGFNDTNIKSKNSIIPIIYFIYKNGNMNENSELGFKQYLIRCAIKNTFGSHGDSLLQKLRDCINENLDTEYKELSEFKWEEINNSIEEMNDNKSLIIHKNDVSRMLSDSTKSNSKLILEQVFDNEKQGKELSYLFPENNFKGKKLEELNLPIEIIEDWPQLAKELPNLFLSDLSSKSLKSILNLNNTDMERQFEKLFIPRNIHNYNTASFEKVFNFRKNKMREKLIEYFNVID